MYEIRLRTKIDLCDEEFVSSLLNDWYYKINSKLRPERFSQGEPVRKKFEEEGVDTAIKLWLKDKLPLLLKRVSNPKFEVDVSGYQAMITETRQFPSSCVGTLTFDAGDDIALELFKFLIEKFEPGFAFISTEEDLKEKHYFNVRVDKKTTHQSYEGLEVGKKLPGIYWVTYFSRWAINKIGVEKFNNINVSNIEEFKDGIILTLYNDSTMICSNEAKDIEKSVINHLGEDHFFNKSQVDLDELTKL